MITRLRQRRQRGFTLIELLIVVAIIGIIAAILIPNLIDALQKAKQKRTVADIRNVGNAWLSWLTDQVSASAAGSSGGTFDLTDYGVITYDTIVAYLRPTDTFFYMQEIPQTDGWKYELQYRFTGDVGLSSVMAIRSAGRRGQFEGDSVVRGAFIATDYDQDIVWADGFFVKWPAGKIGVASTGS